MEKDYFTNISPYIIEDLEFYGPTNAEKYLCDLYGVNWKIPCKSENEYKFWEDSPGIPWTFKKIGEKILKGIYKKQN